MVNAVRHLGRLLPLWASSTLFLLGASYSLCTKTMQEVLQDAINNADSGAFVAAYNRATPLDYHTFSTLRHQVAIHREYYATMTNRLGSTLGVQIGIYSLGVLLGAYGHYYTLASILMIIGGINSYCLMNDWYKGNVDLALLFSYSTYRTDLRALRALERIEAILEREVR